MDDDHELNAARRARMRWNAPLDETHAGLLLTRLDLSGRTVTDLGCGWGELLLRAVASGASGIGVDTDPDALARGRTAATERGLRAEFVEADAAAWTTPAERAICIGSSHAYGGTIEALAALAKVVPAGGRLLYGDGCWPAPPTPAAAAIFPEVLPLTGLLAAADDAGWQVLHLSTADQREWDDFESTSRAGRAEWLLANPDHPRAGEIRAWLTKRQREYVGDYRGVLGFAYLVLAR